MIVFITGPLSWLVPVVLRSGDEVGLRSLDHISARAVAYLYLNDELFETCTGRKALTTKTRRHKLMTLCLSAFVVKDLLIAGTPRRKRASVRLRSRRWRRERGRRSRVCPTKTKGLCAPDRLRAGPRQCFACTTRD